MKSFCIFTNSAKDPGLVFTGEVRKELERLGASVTYDTSEKYECLIVLGGDGTMINAVRSVPREKVVFVGINIGHLGFLSPVEKSEFREALAALVNDEFEIETRMMIEAGTDDESGEFAALNDVVINRIGYSGMITSNVFVNGSLVNTYFADGVIISTPTGSTGYNLSAGGPVVTPEAELMVITPICPHSLNMRSVVVGYRDRIEVVLDLSRLSEQNYAIMSIDGQKRAELGHEARVRVRCSERKVRMVRFSNKDFFKLLYMKLGDQMYK